MEVFIKDISYRASELEIHRHFEKILHGPRYTALWKPGFPVNFSLDVFSAKKKEEKKGQLNRGIAVLRIPSRTIAQTLIDDSKKGTVPPLLGRRLSIQISNKQGYNYSELERTPYKDPEELRERDTLRTAFANIVPVAAVHFGWMDRDQVFSKEWSRDYRVDLDIDPRLALSCQVHFGTDKREISIEESLDYPDLAYGVQPCRLLTRFGNIATLSTGGPEDPQSSLLITLHSPPVLEDPIDRNTPAAMEHIFGPYAYGKIEQKRDRRISFDDPQHLQLVPYVSLAILLEFDSQSYRRSVLDMAKAAKFPHPSTLPSTPESRNHYSNRTLERCQDWISILPWPVGFQCAALIHNLILTPKELLDPSIRDRIYLMALEFRANLSVASNVIVDFGVEVQNMNYVEPGQGQEQVENIKRELERCLERAFEKKGESLLLRTDTENTSLCYHADVTPTSIKLRGPEPVQSNRVLRQYKLNQDYFLRVSFTDEDRLQFRWDRDVNGASFVKQRVGKSPLRIAGRSFEFLAYSNSALKEHCVWFVAPFTDSEGRKVDAESIRTGLGNFDKVIRCAARYGARMSQAFTATDVSVTMVPEEVIVIDDIIRAGVVFTDGVGTCSRKTMDSIARGWRESSSKSKKRHNKLPSAAVQFRLGGIKGMLSVDYKLTDDTIYIRPSMYKFTSASLDLEIASTFENPKPMYLNRPLIMVLETLDVPIQSFVDLQTVEIENITASLTSLPSSIRLLDRHGLGKAFRLSSVFSGLINLGLESPPEDDEFLARGLNYAANDVLRSLKYKSRIPVPQSWTLVGVADVHGYLEEGEICASYSDPDGHLQFVEGRVLITRAPVIHPGDVQMVFAIGKPRPGSPFSFEALPNCVVFATKGQRSTPQSLGGGDLDGDLYNLIQYEPLFPRYTVEPGAYPPTKLNELPEGQRCTIDHIADFVVDFINNDHLGMIATENLILADHSSLMSKDPTCLLLAELHSTAVDFQKSGIPVDLSRIPRRKFTEVPDWSIGELVRNFGKGHTYPSTRALGVLFRNVELPEEPLPDRSPLDDRDVANIASAFQVMNIRPYEDSEYLTDPISAIIKPELEHYISLSLTSQIISTLESQFNRYCADLLSICQNSSLSYRNPLTEEECWAGTIVAKTSQPRRRREAQTRMREGCTLLVDAVRHELGAADDERLADWLERTWAAWKISRRMENIFGAKTYGYIALGSMFEALKAIELRDKEIDG